MKIDYDAPAFGPGSQAADGTLTSETVPAEESLPKVEVEEDEDNESATSSAQDDAPAQKIPYSRFSKVLERATAAEEAAEEARQKYQDLLEERETRNESRKESNGSDPLLGSLIKLYGDNENTREIYKVELEKQAIFEERAEQRAIAAVRAERQQESQALERNEQTIDTRIEALSETIGRSLTEAEELSLLEIVDDYTPKDDDGNYLGDTLSFDKAWEIHEMKQQSLAATSKKARSNATNLTGSKTDGEPKGAAEERNKNFNPLDWNAYRNRL